MSRLTGRFALVLMAVWALALAVVHAQPCADADLQELLSPGAGCSAPCLIGIQPGLTDTDTTLRALAQHYWVGTLHYARGMALDSGFISWSWSGAQPAFIDSHIDGKLWIQSGRVQWIEIGTRFTVGDLWLIAPPSNSYSSPMSVMPPHVQQQVFYGWVEASAAIPCPLTPAGFWRAPLVIRVLSAPVSPGDYRLPRWRGCP